MDIQEIIEQLHLSGILDHGAREYKYLSGGTSSTVHMLLSDGIPELIIKQNNPTTIECESFYLNFYHDNALLPDLIFVNEKYRYLVYDYKPGETRYEKGNKGIFLETLVEKVINKSKLHSQYDGFGYLDDPTSSWKEFLLSRAFRARNVLMDHRVLSEEDHQLIENIINAKEEFKEKYLLHGDCGVHNFLFNNGILQGIIDPTPVIGDPLYDLIYAYCSSPDQLDYETILIASNQLSCIQLENHNINEEVMIGLYFRIATCLVHHPFDLNEYLTAWEYWKSRI